HGSCVQQFVLDTWIWTEFLQEWQWNHTHPAVSNSHTRIQQPKEARDGVRRNNSCPAPEAYQTDRNRQRRPLSSNGSCLGTSKKRLVPIQEAAELDRR